MPITAPRRKSIPTTDVRDTPAYPVAEAARYLRLPAATLRAWVRGTQTRSGRRSPAVIHASARDPLMLSFWNLIEAHVLRALRTDHGVSLPAVRKALRYAEEELGIERLLLSAELKTDAGRLFLDRYGQLTDLTASGQIAMRVLFDQHLKRVEWDQDQFPIRLYPFVQDQTLETDRAIAIDAGIAFGRPIVKRIGVNTSVIADRLDAGETIADVASDYEMTESELASAVLYERARVA